MKRIYDEGCFRIVDEYIDEYIDEYGDEYTWPAFEKRVIGFGDGWDDTYSHLEYENGR